LSKEFGDWDPRAPQNVDDKQQSLTWHQSEILGPFGGTRIAEPVGKGDEAKFPKRVDHSVEHGRHI